ncbi:MAG: hypothetical protein F6K24_02450 [Okeania sp. SIO2D1]|nr:hypothetical protein [Okeania sp. SIO2D1]
MQKPIILRQLVLEKLTKAPIISVQISALDLLVICQALLLWLTIYPGNGMTNKLLRKLRNNLSNLLPNWQTEVTTLLIHGASKAYGDSKTNSQT